MSDRQIALVRAEALIAAAVSLLRPLCGVQVALGLLAKMIEEQALAGIMETPEPGFVPRQPGGDPDAPRDSDGRAARRTRDEAPYLAAR